MPHAARLAAGDRARAASSLARSCHPAPTAAVTVFSLLLGWAGGVQLATLPVLGAAVLCGQLSIGWSNDRIDAGRDRDVGRADKPLAAGEVQLRTADAAIAGALVGVVALSLALGWRAGLVHLAAVGCGWLYNAGLKSTVVSPLPYALAFGALPAVATLAAPGHPAPAAWCVVAGALIGSAANFANAVPDIAEDRSTGVLGLPHRVGERGSIAVAGTLLLGGAICATFGPPGAPPAAAWAGLGAIAALLGAAAWHTRTPAGARTAFQWLMGIAGLDVVLVTLTGSPLH
jgi:4-hydroxybenzoate polyprenyltransferase